MAKKKAYDNDSISSLKGADRVRKRPGVIFGSDGLEGCEHAVFEILSNAIDEARAGFGRVITVTRFQDRSIQVEDQGRGCPVDWNEKEGRYNWELVFCEMYAGGKYDPTGENYEFSLGLNGLGSCATQYASRYMDVTVCRDGNEYKLHFQRGEIVGQMEVTPLTRKKTGTTIRWLPDLEVFTDIDIPLDYYQDVMKRQAVVNAGVTFRLRDEVSPGRFETQDFLYENGIRDYLAELAGDDPITRPVCWEAERTRLGAKKKLSEKIDIANRVQKFVDCRTKEVDRREIYIVEGDSALGACKQSRDAEFQGLMPVRGKILNCLKADYPRIFKSDVITDLMKVLGCGVEVQGKAAKELSQFDLNNLRWSKVVICTDGDVDGFQIRTLILTMLYRLCPTLIREGYVYIAETPLFEITYREKNADKTWFAYSEKEKADIVRQLEGKKFTVQRSKGLGENDPEMMWLTTMNPETRRLVRVLPDEAEETARVFDLLLGDNLAGRKDYIAENGHLYLDMIDVS